MDDDCEQDNIYQRRLPISRVISQTLTTIISLLQRRAISILPVSCSMSTFETTAPKSMLEPLGRGSGETVAWDAIAVANDRILGVFRDECLRVAVRTAILNKDAMVVFIVESLRAKGELAFNSDSRMAGSRRWPFLNGSLSTTQKQFHGRILPISRSRRRSRSEGEDKSSQCAGFS